METQIIFDTEYIRIDYQPTTKIVHAFWKGWANDADYCQAIDIQVNTVVQKKATYILVDICNFKGTSPANQKYTNTKINEMINSKNLKKVAYVVGENIFAKFTLTNIRKEIDGSMLTTNAFLSVKDAEKWLFETK